MDAVSSDVAQKNTERQTGLLWNGTFFALHLAVVYLIAQFGITRLAGFINGTLLPLLRQPSNDSGLQFYFSHILALCVVFGVAAGVATTKWNRGVAQYVWLLPSAVLAYKFFTYPASVLQNRFELAFHHYFGSDFLILSYRSFDEMVKQFAANPDVARAFDQQNFTAPVYIGVAYALANWIGSRLSKKFPGF